MKFLKDPVWQFVSVVIGIIAIFVSFYISNDERPSKKLRVEILSNNPLISVDTNIANEIEVTYKDIPVESLSLILLRFENTGNEPIGESDYSEPIRITLSENAEIGEATIQETKPVGINLSSTIISNNQIELAKTLLNPGDQVVVKILAINNDETLKINARIAGIQNIEVVSVLENQSNTNSSRNFGLTIAGAYCLLILLAIIWNSKRVVEWRIKKFGYDPALEAYAIAQNKMSRNSINAELIREAISSLRTAFSWDISYLEKAKNDPLFSKLQNYEVYKALILEYEKVKNAKKNIAS